MISHRFPTRLSKRLSNMASAVSAATFAGKQPVVYYNPWHIFHASKTVHPESPDRIKGIMTALDVFLKAGAAHLRTFTHADFKPFDDDPEKEVDDWVTEDGDNYRTKYTDSILKISREMLVAAVDDICLRGLHCGFVLNRPPGHHASEGVESGFCFENNVWTAVEALLGHGKRRISIYDWDVHHGDGTERCFRAALKKDAAKYDNIRFVSTHAYGRGIYPGSGAASSDKHILNIPLKKGTLPDTFLNEFETAVFPFVRDCEILIISAGFDAHKEDPMGLMKLETSTYGTMSRRFAGLGVPVLFILEGGYNPKILGDCARETLLQWM
jgi:acetoin utilization deacetylase AcuC-like enzyme